MISKLEYSLGKLKSYLSLPVYFYTSRYSEKTTASKEKYTKLSLNPRLYVTYPFSSRWQMDITGSVSSSPSGESLFYIGYIMNSYRTMSEGYPVYKQNRRQMIEGNLSYKQAMEELLGNLRVRVQLHILLINNFRKDILYLLIKKERITGISSAFQQACLKVSAG